ncbi:MAG: 16S rRNA (guanine(527)-N(7))-methyltransferase RsmG [Eubacterium sp.]|nr:16S rRNA (guanine(527)-N(7))-methyltransferase RsmG [Eubacterium sp.]
MGLLEEILKKLNISLNEDQKQKFSDYYSLLLEKNKVMNLTRITDEEEFIIKHFADSLMISKVIEMEKIESLIDVGTGAGFPGIPIKIIYPNIKVTLLDSLDKRVGFLKEVIEKLELEDIEAVHGRAEDLGQDDNYREKYDLCVSRAVADLSVLSEYCIPFVKENGEFVSYKAEGSDKEIYAARNAIETLGAGLNSICTEKIPNTDINRQFAIIKKILKTDPKYPRKAGKPSKKPLK